MQLMDAAAPPEQLGDAVDALVAESIDHLPARALGEDLIDLRRCIDRLEAEFVRRLQLFDQRKGALEEGGVSTVSWLRHRCRMTARSAGQHTHMSRALVALPSVLDSARAGRSPLCNTAMVGRLADDVGAERVAPVEEVVLNAAETFEPAVMFRFVMEARLRLDPDGALDAANRAHERRWFACDETYGGSFVVRGELDAEGGMIVRTAIDALMPVPTPDDTRTASQRRADALVDLAGQQLQLGEHREIHGRRPHLTLTTTLAALQGGDDSPLPQLAGLGVVHPETARRIACDASQTDVATSDASSADVQPLSVGRARRTVPAPLRSALRLRDKGCTFPGCDRPPEWTDAHHIRHWADGGETSLSNLLLLCRRHHRSVHEGGWRLHVVDGAVSVVPPPDG